MKHKILITILASAMFTAAGTQAIAQKNKNLSLDEAIQLSVRNSGQLKLANAKVDEAIANYHEVWNNYLPDVKVSGALFRLIGPNVNLKVKLGGSATDTSAKSAAPVKVEQAAYGMVNASLPLFSG